MDVERIQSICLKLPGVTEDIKWEHHLCFCVASKMFLMLGLDEAPVTASFKVSDEDFDSISARKGFIPAPYMARNKWVKVDDISRMGDKEWQEIALNAYTLIRNKLPKKLQASLG